MRKLQVHMELFLPLKLMGKPSGAGKLYVPKTTHMVEIAMKIQGGIQHL